MTTLYSFIICAIFLAGLFLISKLLSYRGFSWKSLKKKETHRWIHIVDRQYIGKNTCLLAVKVNDKHLLLGVTEHKIDVLQEINIKKTL